MTLSAAATPFVQATSSEIVFLCLLTFSLPNHDSLRVVNNTEDVVSRGNTFTAFPFAITLPNDDSDRLPTVQLRISNVAGEIMEYIRSLPQAPTVLLELVTSVDYNFVEKAVGYLKMESVTYDAMEVSGSLTLDNILSRRLTASDYDPVQFPALFTT